MKVIEEFWYGNLYPMERPFYRRRKIEKILKLLNQNEENLLESLNETEKELFQKYKECNDEILQITECEVFRKVVKLGERFFIECYENDADIFDE